ncbi:uncharacterized protein BT62DRAFT_1070403 [Guyanagaster necrorhizus]|uniref:Chromatin assembly factor 1 subunit A dimerization domain-containing protein n=1 Tax=Guyanagaster necrorhizus TaxID=856835 RepID=A0A9P8AYM6_9AGAR|nr:uncharacterized protein BT62DRAFT_1070403 [Guyanagaster necrorhizus MCA 3950]KAG7452660.1 hypothetical protein BT62DRAFT_1070403 [Guyanagaster necrorhizus MCA 3950]
MNTPNITIVNPEAQKTEKPLNVEIRNNKVIFKQRVVSLEKQSETLQEIVKFRELLESCISSGNPLVTIPDDSKPVVAKLAFESDKSLQVLAKHVRQELLPIQNDDDRDVSALLPVTAVEAVIKSTMNRNNYGLDVLSGVKIPSSSCVWRWEMKDEYKDWLPKAVREKTEARIAERVEAKKALKALFEALPQQERDSMLGYKGATTSISPARDALQAFPTNTSQEDAVHFCSQPEQGRELSKEPSDNQSSGSSSKRSKKPVDPLRAAKDKEKSEKKAAKAEKEKKEKESQNKSRSLMVTFFSKPKGPAPPSTSNQSETRITSSLTAISDFDRMFKPFVLKKDAELAPWNRFLQKHRPCGSQNNVIVIDDDNEETPTLTTCHKSSEVQVEKLTSQERLQDILSSITGLAPSLTRRRTTPFKAYSSVSVRDMVTRLSEAEVTGDTGLVRDLLSKLSDRASVPAKVFIFADDARPGYFGTWTRSSKTIGPRTPFHKDTLEFDYAYDSGEEWEEEPPGEADDVIDDDDDEGEAEDFDSDMDDWLVDDDIGEPGTPLEDKETSFIPDVCRVSKRKPEATENKPPKKRKMVVPLVPYARGPCWEDAIGECLYDAFKPYRIRLFNDTPFPVDPFTFCSMPQQTPFTFVAASRHDDRGFAVPSVLVRTTKAQESSNMATQPLVVPKDPVPKKVAPPPKTVFPETHLPLLLSKINALQTTNLTFLVEAIYQDLRTHKIKKNAIEAKVREVGEKSKDTKFWKVKPGFEQENPAMKA